MISVIDIESLGFITCFWADVFVCVCVITNMLQGESLGLITWTGLDAFYVCVESVETGSGSVFERMCLCVW